VEKYDAFQIAMRSLSGNCFTGYWCSFLCFSLFEGTWA